MIALGLVSEWVLPYVKYGVDRSLRGLAPIDQGFGSLEVKSFVIPDPRSGRGQALIGNPDKKDLFIWILALAKARAEDDRNKKRSF